MAKEKQLSFIDFDISELESFQQSIGRNVARMRQEKGLSQLDLSHLIGHQSVSLVAGAEAGFRKVRFNTEHLYKISRVLNIDICEFFKPIPQNQ